MSNRHAAMLLVALAACEDSAPTAPIVDPVLAERIDRGRYLVDHVSQCNFCHTVQLADGSRDITVLLAGVPTFIDLDRTNPDVGAIGTANLTPDPATGIGNFSDDQVVAAIRDGQKLDGSGVTQVHPSYIFKNMTEDDARAIVAYLRTLPPVANTIPPRQPPWTLMAERQPFDFGTYTMPVGLSGADQDSALRGRYLVGAAGFCNFCHTPTVMGATDFTKILAGGVAIRKEQLYGSLPGFPATIFGANLTPDATGIGAYTLDDIRTVFRKGRDRNGDCLCAPTHGSPAAPFAGLSDDDVTDIGRFLLAQPPIANPAARPMDCQAPGFCSQE